MSRLDRWLGNRPAMSSCRSIGTRGVSTEGQLLIFLTVCTCATFFFDGSAGVGFLGLAVLFIALQLDADHGTLSISYLTRQATLRDIRPQVRAQAATDLVEIEAISRPLRLAKLLGLGLAVVGIGAG